MKLGSSPDHRTGGIAQQTVDTHAVALVGVELAGLCRYSPSERGFSSSRTIHGFTFLSFVMNDVMSTTEVTDHGEVAQGLDPNRAGRVLAQERGAGERGLAVHHHPAAAAHAHPARPPVRERAIERIFDVVDPIEDGQSSRSGTS